MTDTVFVYDGDGPFPDMCRATCAAMLFDIVVDPSDARVAIAPRLTRKLAAEEYSAPKFGTLIFHPSALPHRRGPDAIRWSVHYGDRVSAATWFWCDGGLDTGPICEQEVVVMKPGESAGRAYYSRFVPAGLRALERALRSVRRGLPNRIAQEAWLESYQGRYIPESEPHPVEMMGPGPWQDSENMTGKKAERAK